MFTRKLNDGTNLIIYIDMRNKQAICIDNNGYWTPIELNKNVPVSIKYPGEEHVSICYMPEANSDDLIPLDDPKTVYVTASMTYIPDNSLFKRVAQSPNSKSTGNFLYRAVPQSSIKEVDVTEEPRYLDISTPINTMSILKPIEGKNSHYLVLDTGPDILRYKYVEDGQVLEVNTVDEDGLNKVLYFRIKRSPDIRVVSYRAEKLEDGDEYW